jgi:hypothetical protein
MAMAKRNKEYYRLKKAKILDRDLLRKRIAFAIVCERGMDPRLAFQQIYSVQNCPKDSQTSC